ncbi:UrcA family protein [Sandarakinorhabdus sp.]|uniref:UrcA family protein n=1 Tax=Sandarakinorhabdus sp. TaxID=1916663 RepID=UPI00286E62CB|nr:UrcA family protein [Sandarakinorhabdus sp.]
MFALSTSILNRNVIGTVGTVFFAGLCLAAAAAPAAASETHRTAVVSYSDLDLASQAGQKTLERRVRTAAKEVCETGSQDAWSRAAKADCFRTTVEKSLNGVNAKMS